MVELARARVHDGVRETAYVRAGTGAWLLLLAPVAARHHWLVRCSADFRVLAPEPPPGVCVTRDVGTLLTSFVPWLAGFLDGLGIGTVDVIADGPFASPAYCFSLVEPARVGRLTLCDSEGDARRDAVVIDRRRRNHERLRR